MALYACDQSSFNAPDDSESHLVIIVINNSVIKVIILSMKLRIKIHHQKNLKYITCSTIIPRSILKKWMTVSAKLIPIFSR